MNVQRTLSRNGYPNNFFGPLHSAILKQKTRCHTTPSPSHKYISLEVPKSLSQKQCSLGWRPGPDTAGQKFEIPQLLTLPTENPKTKNDWKIFNWDYKTSQIRRGLKQFSSGWRFLAKNSAGRYSGRRGFWRFFWSLMLFQYPPAAFVLFRDLRHKNAWISNTADDANRSYRNVCKRVVYIVFSGRYFHYKSIQHFYLSCTKVDWWQFWKWI